MTGSRANDAAKFICTFADWVWIAAFQLAAVGASFWQQPWDAGISMLPHRPCIRLQQACSAGLRRVLGSAQAIVGVTSGNIIARINANWRTVFTRVSILRQFQQHNAQCMEAPIQDRAGSRAHDLTIPDNHAGLLRLPVILKRGTRKAVTLNYS